MTNRVESIYKLNNSRKSGINNRFGLISNLNNLMALPIKVQESTLFSIGADQRKLNRRTIKRVKQYQGMLLEKVDYTE